MPETTVDENDCLMTREYKVRFAWKVGDMQTVAQAKSMKDATQGQLRLAILAPDTRHPFRALGGRQEVNHLRINLLGYALS